MHPPTRALMLVTLSLATLASWSRPAAATLPTPVFFSDFESGIPPEFTAPGAHLDGVQGWAGLGEGANRFEGSFLRYDAAAVLDTRLVVRNLPSHTLLNLSFLLAVIDSWDGVELLQVRVDGQLLYSNWFQLALGDTTSYIPPPGTLLSAGTNLGYTNGSYYAHDRAYNLAFEPAFQNIPHTADSVEVVWSLDAIPGGGANYWQGGADESWAIDHVRLEVLGANTDDAPEPRTGLGLALHAPSPHPARARGFSLAVSLPSSEPATLELFDVSGRRVAERRIESPAQGVQRIELGRGAALSPGVHLARLTQGGEVRTMRVVLMR